MPLVLTSAERATPRRIGRREHAGSLSMLMPTRNSVLPIPDLWTSGPNEYPCPTPAAGVSVPTMEMPRPARAASLVLALTGCVPPDDGGDDEVGDPDSGVFPEDAEFGDGGAGPCAATEVSDPLCDEQGWCSGGVLQGHLARARPNMNLLPPLVVKQSNQDLSFRLFGVGPSFRILEARVRVHHGGVIGADGIVVGSAATPAIELDPPAGNASPSVINASVAANLEPGANFVEIEVEYAGGSSHRLLAAVVFDTGRLLPTILHVASEDGPRGDTALVGQQLTISGFGFGARQFEEGVGFGHVEFAADISNDGIDAGTVFSWGENRILVHVPERSSERETGERAIVITPASGLVSAPWDFPVSPRLIDPPSCPPAYKQFAGEGKFEPDLRYTKDADARDFDQDGDVDIFSPVSHPQNAIEALDRLHMNRINVEADFEFARPLSFSQTTSRYNNRPNDGFCGQDDHAPAGEGPATYESGVADFDNDGDLDILDPHGPQGVACNDVPYTECAGSNWLRLSLSRASESSSFVGDFFFVDEAGDFESINGRIYAAGNTVLDAEYMANSVLDDVDIGDLDGDGDLDVILANRTGPYKFDTTNLLLVNRGGDQGGEPGWFDAQLLGDPLRPSHTIEMVDIDGDGDLDLVLAIECTKFSVDTDCFFGSDDGVVILRNEYILDGKHADASGDIEFVDVTSEWVDTTSWSVPQGSVAVEIVHLAGDGLPDVLLGSPGVESKSRLLRHAGDRFVVEPLVLGDRVYGVTPADLDRDGRSDLLIPNFGFHKDTELTIECESGTADMSRCWPQIALGDGVAFGLGVFPTDQASSFWFDPEIAAEAGVDPTIHSLAVTGVFAALDAEAPDFDADGVLDAYFVTGETRQLNFGGGHHSLSDWDRIYISNNQCGLIP